MPGFQFPDSQVFITDAFGQIVKTDNDSIVTVYTDNDAELSGKARIQASSAVFSIKDIIVKAQPGISVSLKLETDAIDKERVFSNKISQNTMKIMLNIKDCLRGQILVEGR